MVAVLVSELSVDELRAELAKREASLDGLRRSYTGMDTVDTLHMLANQANVTHEEDDEPFGVEDYADELTAVTPPQQVTPRPRPEQREIPLPPHPSTQPAFPPLGPTVDQQQLVARAVTAMQAQIPDWSRYGRRVWQATADNPTGLGKALETNNPAAVVSVLADTYERLRTQDAATNMKLQAQTMSGSHGRVQAPSGDEAEWQQIVNVGKKSRW